jgi:RsiW-degrading membrane proteinase PrsW (M82 family)
MDAKTAEFRARYREEEISARYRGWPHFAFTSLGSASVIVYAILSIAAPTNLELLVVPFTFLFANFVEYRVHRGPMHHPSKVSPLRLLYTRHTLQHHRFFTEDSMEHEGSRDFAAVLFPPVMLIFFLGCIATPVGALLFTFASGNIAWLFVATVLSYFLNYEWLHFAYHQPEDGWIAKLPLMSTLRNLHTKHHDPRHMSTANFNITYPICDLLFGTYRR